MTKTLLLLTGSNKEDAICVNSEASVFFYYQGSSTVKTLGKRKLYMYVGNRTSEKTERAVRAVRA